MKMAKLTAEQKEIFEMNMEMAKEENITFVQSEGKTITIAVKPNDRMHGFARVYVAYCGYKDKPKRKLGINAVMDRVANDNYILVPMETGASMEDMAYRMLAIMEENFYW